MDWLSFVFGIGIGYFLCLFAAWKDGLFKK